MSGKRKQGRTKKTWKKLVEEETEKITSKKGGALNRANERRRASNCRRNGANPAISTKGTTPDKN